MFGRATIRLGIDAHILVVLGFVFPYLAKRLP